MKFIPYGRQAIDKNDIQEVVKALRSDWITQGPRIREFESLLCRYTGAKYAVAVSSGTAALHIACLAAGLKPSDEVITSPITFVASANCVLYCQGKPVFADIQSETVNIDPQEIKKKITSRTKAIIPVDFSGYPCDLEAIKKIAVKHKLILIEDAAHAFGADYKGSKIGSGKYADMTIFSFHPVKSITTGEGGAVLTNREDLYARLLLFRNHGITKDERMMTNNPGPWYYEMQELGFNYRITDFQAALGISQIKKADKLILKRKKLAGMYNDAFKDIPWIELIKNNGLGSSAYHIYVLRFDFKRIKKSRLQVMNYLRKRGIGTQVHYIPVHTQPFYKKAFNYKAGDYPVAERYYETALTLPLFPDMAKKDLRYVIGRVLSLSPDK